MSFINDDGPVRYMACRWCQKQTLVETLSMYGARCFECFETYCNPAGDSQRYIKPDPAKLRRYFTKLANGIREAQRNPRAWADALRAREESGEVLTPAQKAAWRGVHGGVIEAMEDE
jgi:hypothetical protein